MSAEELPEARPIYIHYKDHADSFLYSELVRKQNENSLSNQVIFVSGSFQKLCAESLVNHLREKPYFQKFGGKTLNIVMLPTEEYYMFSVGIQISDT